MVVWFLVVGFGWCGFCGVLLFGLLGLGDFVVFD